MSRWPWYLYRKTQLTPAATTGFRFPPHRLLHPNKSGNERGCTAHLRWRKWVWPRAAKSGVDPPQFTTSRWAAEMSSRTDGPEQITNNTQRSKTAETHCWRWLILQKEIWGRTTEKRVWEEGGVGGREERTGASGTRHKNICFLLNAVKSPFSEWNLSRFPNTYFL